MTGEGRDIRDALAQALNWQIWDPTSEVKTPAQAWALTGPLSQRAYRQKAADILAALPSVKLMMVWEE